MMYKTLEVKCSGTVDVHLVFYGNILYMIELVGDNHAVDIYEKDGKIVLKVYGGVVVEGFMTNEQLDTLMNILERYTRLRCVDEIWIEGI